MKYGSRLSFFKLFLATVLLFWFGSSNMLVKLDLIQVQRAVRTDARITHNNISKQEETNTNASIRGGSLPIDLVDIPVATRPVYNASCVLYNRVPKCGSTTMINTLKYLRSKLGFDLINVNKPHIQMFINESLQEHLAKVIIDRNESDTFYVRHVHFIDFSRFSSKWPIYINVVRDPVERFISYYSYIRHGFETNQGNVKKNWMFNMTTERQKMSLEQCVLQNADKCVRTNAVTMLAFFCGHEKKCREYSDYALEKAKENAARYFTVIGLVEDLPNTFKILGALLPRYFTSTAVLEAPIKDTRTFMKEPATPKVKALLRKALRVDVAFYNFVKQRFYKQLNLLVQAKSVIVD